MTNRSLAVVLALALAPLAGAATTSARAAVAEGDKASARRLLDEGRALLERGEHAQALAKFEAADAIIHVPSTMYYRALALEGAGRLVAARGVALEAASMPATSEESEVRSPFRAKAQALADALDARIPRVRVTVAGGVGARVTVDGVEVSSLAAPLAIDPGAHRVEATLDGRHAQVDLRLAEGDRREIGLDVAARAPSAPRDGTPSALAAPPAPPAPPRRTRSDGASALIYGGFGLAIGGVLAGSAFGLWGMSEMGSARARCDGGRCDEAARPYLDRADRAATWSNLSFAIAGVGLGAGIVGLSLPLRQDVAIVPGPTGLAVVGRF